MAKKFINSVTAISFFIALDVAVLYRLPDSRGVACFWSTSNSRFDINVERGNLRIRQLHDYKFNTAFRWGFYSTETPKQIIWFKETGWWHGENSWWERIGYTVTSRYRAYSFEYASGQYWPPFVWRHPKVPFTVYNLPVWSLIALFSLLPLLRVSSAVVSWICNRLADRWVNCDIRTTTVSR